jgi:hypothetical protein
MGILPVNQDLHTLVVDEPAAGCPAWCRQDHSREHTDGLVPEHRTVPRIIDGFKGVVSVVLRRDDADQDVVVIDPEPTGLASAEVGELIDVLREMHTLMSSQSTTHDTGTAGGSGEAAGNDGSDQLCPRWCEDRHVHEFELSSGDGRMHCSTPQTLSVGAHGLPGEVLLERLSWEPGPQCDEESFEALRLVVRQVGSGDDGVEIGAAELRLLAATLTSYADEMSQSD